MTWVLRSDVLGTDDTPVQMQEKDRGKTKRSYLWGYRGDEAYPFNVFDFTTSHSRDGPMKFLRRAGEKDSEKMFRGYLQADAFAGYDILFEKGDVVEVACWAHTRRKFFEAKETDLACGMEALARIKRLYDIEHEVKELVDGEQLSAEILIHRRLELRQE